MRYNLKFSMVLFRKLCFCFVSLLILFFMLYLVVNCGSKLLVSKVIMCVVVLGLFFEMFLVIVRVWRLLVWCIEVNLKLLLILMILLSGMYVLVLVWIWVV